MTKSEIIEKLFRSNSFKNLVDNVVGYSNQLKDDLIQEVMLILLTKSDEQIIDLDQKHVLFYYTFGIIRNQFRGNKNTSSFYRKFENKNEIVYDNIENIEIETENIDEKYEKELEIMRESKELYRCINQMHPYDSIILKMYYKLDQFSRIDGKYRDKDDLDKSKSSIRKISKLIGCNRNVVHLVLKRSMKFVEDNIKIKVKDDKNNI